MTLEHHDPNKMLDEFRRQANATLDDLLSELSSTCDNVEPIAFQPEVDLVETISEFRFYLSVPGMIEDDLLIDINERGLTIQGQRTPPYDPGVRGVSLMEWRYGFFERHFELETQVEVTSVRAAYEAGVLTIIASKLSPTHDLDQSGSVEEQA